MALIPVDKLESVELLLYLITGYNRLNSEKEVYGVIVQCQMSYLNGVEGIPTAHSLIIINDDNIEMAEEQKIAYQPRHHQLIDLIDIIRIISPKYFVSKNAIPTRQQWCIEMRNNHNVPNGAAIKAYRYICNMRTNPEGIEIKENVNDQCSSNHDSKRKQVSKIPFISKNINILIAKQLMKILSGLIEEKFKTESVLYYYINMSMELQINDDEMMLFTILMDGKQTELSIINYDLQFKGTDNMLYGIIITSNEHNEMSKLWKLDGCLSEQQILYQYGIQSSDLPKSSRRSSTFLKQLHVKLNIDRHIIDLLNNTNWDYLEQINSSNINDKFQETIIINKEIWIKECKKSFANIDKPLIPVVVNKDNKHWIEWVKIIHIESQNIYIAISCKYDTIYNKWSIESICLDCDDIYNKHRLIGLKYDYCQNIPVFAWEKLKFKAAHNNNEVNKDNMVISTRNDTDKKINILKQQMVSQQDSIKRLKESISLNVENRDKYINDNIDIHLMTNVDDMDNMEDTTDGVSQIIDDVIKKYDVMAFKKNICINKQFTKSWINYVLFPRFNDEVMMYYWLDHTTAIQMIQGYGKQYVDKINGIFICAVINYELKDNQNNDLYGIIFIEDIDDRNNDKYSYKLTKLMTAEHIHREFGINGYDLPKKSRKHNDFINKLILKRNILKQDLNEIRWSNLKLFKSQSNNTDPVNKSVAMTRNVMKEYINISIERINNDNDNDRKRENNLIPILVIDKYNNYYGIEWVLIVHIIHCNCFVGVSFKYNTNKNLFIATSIYLDKEEIESKHKLIGLKYDYCQNIPSLSLKKLKFKDDDIVYNNNNNDKSIIIDRKAAVEEYKNLIQKEQIKTQQLQQEMVNQHQAHLQKIENVKQENKQYLLQHYMDDDNNKNINQYCSQ